jgi:redox-sensitive bicupin YhaK (pirin superfamily)
MIDIRKFATLGAANFGWLDAHHHFSFGNYHNPKRMGHGALRVWNDDLISAQSGFPMHPHQNMEIITYVRKGAISHEDHLGNKGRTVAGDVQVMSAGSGISHSEWNKETQDTSIFQIWILPQTAGGTPRWDTAHFPKGENKNQMVTLAAGGSFKTENALFINQDAAIHGVTLEAGEEVSLSLGKGRYGYIVSAKGNYSVNGIPAHARDGVAVRDEETLVLKVAEDATEPAEILIADVPA